MTDRFAKYLLSVLFFLLAFSVTCSLSEAPATASGWNRSAAVKYAQKYSCNGKNCGNPAYIRFSNDCTNFVSQALKAGGQKINGTEETYRWYYTNSSNYSTSWISVAYFRQFMVVGAKRADYKSVSMSAAYTAAQKGDVYLYDWGEGNGYSHLAIATGWGKFGSYYDSSKKKNYNQITGGKGDKMAQHSTDRDGAPWNWGYQTQKNPKIRKKMRTVLIAFKG